MNQAFLGIHPTKLGYNPQLAIQLRGEYPNGAPGLFRESLWLSTIKLKHRTELILISYGKKHYGNKLPRKVWYEIHHSFRAFSRHLDNQEKLHP